MDQMLMGMPPVSEEDKKKSYFKYYLEDMAQPDPGAFGAMAGHPLPPFLALPFAERNRLFEPGYSEAETGYSIMPDGTAYVANLTKMPGVTAEMIDWWFSWYSLDSLRYLIWDKQDHLHAECLTRVRATDPDMTDRERLWDTSQDLLDAGDMGPNNIIVHFKHPGNLGFAAEKIGTEACTTMITALGFGKGQPPLAPIPTVTVHQVRETEDGVEVRSRYWMGWTYKNGRDVKVLPDGLVVPPMGPIAVGMQNIREMTNLAALLPRIYPEEKGTF